MYVNESEVFVAHVSDCYCLW